MTPSTSELTLTIRGDEIDRTGQVNPAQLLRFAEHARWQATADGGPLQQLFSGDERMVVRAQRVAPGVAATWQDEIRVQTWLVRLGRTSVDMAHHITRVDNGEVVAEVLLTGVHVDASGRPAELPASLHQATLGPAPGGAIAGLHFAPVPDDAWTWPLQIRLALIDVFQHVNHANYLDLAEDVRWHWEQSAVSPTWRPGRSLVAAGLEYVREIRVDAPIVAHAYAPDDATLHIDLRHGETIHARLMLQVGP